MARRVVRWPWPWKRGGRGTLRVEVPRLTFGLWRECRRAVGAPPKGGPAVPAWDAATAPLAECEALLRALDTEGAAPEAATRAAAGRAWAVLCEQAEADLGRANATIERVERALGLFLDTDGAETSPERGIYQLDPVDVDALLAWPLWLAVEYLGVRSVEHEHQDELRRSASLN